MSAKEAFDPNRPLPESAVRALEHLDQKDAEIARLKEALHRIAMATHQDVPNFTKGCGQAHGIAREALDA